MKKLPVKTAPPKKPHLATGPVRKMGPKPKIRMQKLKPVPPGAFPTAPQAFPGDAMAAGGGGPDLGGAGAEGMPPSAAPGDTGE